MQHDMHLGALTDLSFRHQLLMLAMVQHQAVASSGLLGQAKWPVAMGVRSPDIQKLIYRPSGPSHVPPVNHIQQGTYHAGMDERQPVKGIL